MSGYIKLYRGWRKTDGIGISAVYSEAEAWLWLLENAAWKETTRWNGKGQEVRIQPGQIHVSLRSLSTAWGWSKSKVERFLARLERVKKAGQQTGQSGIVLTIENWAKYQGDGTASGTDAGTVAGRSRDRQEEGKERKEEKKASLPDFPDWIPVDAFRSFEAMRKAIRKPLTGDARKLAIGKLEALRRAGHDPKAVLEQSVMNSWQGLFEIERSKAKAEPVIGI